MKHKLLLAFLSLTLITGAAYAKKPPKTPDMPQLSWVDATGEYIGLTQFLQDTEFAGVLFEDAGELYAMNVRTRDFTTEEDVYFGDIDCGGNAYMSIKTRLANDMYAGYYDGLFYIPPENAVGYVEYSYGTGALCINHAAPINQTIDSERGLVIRTIDTSQYQRPFRMELE